MPRVSAQHLEARRRQILNAARLCFSRNGFHATTMQDILQESGLSAGAVYRYFAGKDDITDAIATETQELFRSALDDLVQDDDPPSPADFLLRLLRKVEQVDERRDLVPLMLSIWAECNRNAELTQRVRAIVDEMTDVLTPLIKRYQAEGLVAGDVAPRKVARAMEAIIPGFLLQYRILGITTAASSAAGFRALLNQ